ncbi:MAG: M48 family metallopeptidase [Candidatus Micrarchaeia archaeon]
MRGLLLNGKLYKLSITYTPYRTASARIAGDTVRIRIPYMAKDKRKLYKRLIEKIAKSVEKYGTRRSIDFREGMLFEAMGRRYMVSVLRSCNDGKAYAYVKDGSIVICTGEGTGSNANALAIKALSKDLLPCVSDIARRASKMLNTEVNGVRIRNLSRLWGSYSSRSKMVTINFRLLFAPQRIIEYVVLHEVAHSLFMDHSKDFWSVIERSMPDYRERRRWLRLNGNALAPDFQFGERKI